MQRSLLALLSNIQSPQWILLGQTKNYPLKGRYQHFCNAVVAAIYLRPRSDPLGQPALAPILNRSLPGGCLPVNKGTLAWGQDGLLAYAAHSNVVVIEPTTVQTFQCLTRYTHDIGLITNANQSGTAALLLPWLGVRWNTGGCSLLPQMQQER